MRPLRTGLTLLLVSAHARALSLKPEQPRAGGSLSLSPALDDVPPVGVAVSSDDTSTRPTITARVGAGAATVTLLSDIDTHPHRELILSQRAHEEELRLWSSWDRHTAARHHAIRLSSGEDIPSGYFKHPSKAAVGPSFNLQLASREDCVAKCDEMGRICAGIMEAVVSGKCELVPHGYGLSADSQYDFYRKKMDERYVVWTAHKGSAIPSDIYEWYSVNGTMEYIKGLCLPEQQCSGFYMCTSGTQDANCGHLNFKADAVLLSGVPAPELMTKNVDSIVYAKEQFTTCEGTANGATCNFPFQAAGSGLTYYECSIVNSERPWCYTTRPGKWGYCDCNGANPIGLEWKFGAWGACTKSCGTGTQDREVTCHNSTTGDKVDNFNLCGVLPPTKQVCNTHDCTRAECQIESKNRKICTGFYEDQRSKVSSIVSQKNLCRSYGCCYAVLDAAATKLGSPKCYTSSKYLEGGCASQSRGRDAITNVTQCGNQCCSASAENGACGNALGYAQVGASDPCARYKKAANTMSDKGWRAFPDGQRTGAPSADGQSCASLSTIKAESVRECQARCSADANCNSINFNSKASLCELLKCSNTIAPPLMASVGWSVFTFGMVQTGPVVAWQVGKWSKCKPKVGDRPVWGKTTCDLETTRAVACVENNGTTMADLLCRRREAKPQARRTCWGDCNVTRSCEELGWDSPPLYGDSETCGAGVGLGGNTFGLDARGWESESYTFPNLERFNHGPSQGCNGEKNYSEAHAICKQAGARMCTYDEMNAEATLIGICPGDLFWTSTKCPDEATGPGRWVAPAVWRPSSKTKGCAREAETAYVACCSDFDTVNISRTEELSLAVDNRKFGPLKEGYTGWCSGASTVPGVYGGHPCKRYSGDCTPFPRVPHFSDCYGNDYCCKGCGPKYDFLEGTSVCIPRYHTNQISFTPTKVMRSQPTRFVFSPRGDTPFPEKAAIVRIVKGYNYGCMGVWDGSADIAASSDDTGDALKVKAGWRLRPANFPQRKDESCGGGVCSPRLPYATEPYIEWEGVILDEGLKVPEEDFEEGMHHVCLCDASVSEDDCLIKRNWHDLGELVMEPMSDRFPKQPAASGGTDMMLLAVDGDLLSTYTWNDVLRVDNVNIFHEGPTALHELCSQRCMQNTLCRGFTMTLPFEPVWMHANPSFQPVQWTAKCALKGDKVKLIPLKRADIGSAVMRWYYQKTDAQQDEWHYWPKVNWNSYGEERQILDNPTLVGRTHPFSGLNATTVPLLTDAYAINGSETGMLRHVMRIAFRGAYRSGSSWKSYNVDTSRQTAEFTYEERGHSGDGKILPALTKAKRYGDDRHALSRGSNGWASRQRPSLSSAILLPRRTASRRRTGLMELHPPSCMSQLAARGVCCAAEGHARVEAPGG